MIEDRCYYCEKAIKKYSLVYGDKSVPYLIRFTKDHIIPLSLGGIDHPKNIVFSCYLCNRFKADLLPEQFLEAVRVNRYTSYSKKTRIAVIVNVKALLDLIGPFRSTLFHPGKYIPQLLTRDLQNQEEAVWIGFPYVSPIPFPIKYVEKDSQFKILLPFLWGKPRPTTNWK
ncbi:HNH endonuclease [Puia dinghuensis]|uniref:HNH endonuclease n=1 Tax=Puia dinghuensis TaxID=1792502 RepID=UPI0016664CAB